jgi:hypothetical protein
MIELEPWLVTTRINKAGNLTLDISLNGEQHAEVILQEGGIIDVGARVSPWPLGEKGWGMPGAPKGFRKFRFDPASQTELHEDAE